MSLNLTYMKKLFTLILLCVIPSLHIHSQETESQNERKTTYGVKLGYNSTNYVDLFNPVPYGGFLQKPD